MQNRVVITGMSIWYRLGVTLDEAALKKDFPAASLQDRNYGF